MVSEQDKKHAEEYKKCAQSGMDLLFPVRIKGQTHRSDINWPYHVTIMLFDTEKDSVEDAHEVAKKLALNPPDPKKVTIKLGTMEGRTGYKIYNLDLMGPENDRIKSLYEEFSHLGFKNGYKFQAHISVDKQTWEDMKAGDGKTAFELGIEFLPAELRVGEKLAASYKPEIPTDFGREYPAEDKLRASENLDLEILKETAFYIDALRYSLAVSLPSNLFKNWLEDNKELKTKLLHKHEDRVNHHFGQDAKLFNYAIEHGVSKTYALMRKK